MLSNYFSCVNNCKKTFKLDDFNINKISKEKNEVYASKFKEELILKNETKKVKKVIIKAFSIEPNINGYGVIVKEKRNLVEKALESIRNIFNTEEIIFVIDGKDKTLASEIATLGKVKKVKSILDFYDDELVLKIYGNKTNINEVLIEDFMTLVYLGQEELKEGSMIYLTVYGSAVEGNKVIGVPYNTKLETIFTELNGDISTLKKIVLGGSINGLSKYNLDYKIDYNVKSILFLNEKDSPKEKVFSCIRCGKCLRICKEGLNPIKLMELHKKNEKDEFIKFRGENCIECGLCSYICPSNLELAQSIKTAKLIINKEKEINK